MKLSKSKLKQLIREELNTTLSEEFGATPDLQEGIGSAAQEDTLKQILDRANQTNILLKSCADSLAAIAGQGVRGEGE